MATKTVVAVLPVALTCAYASNLFVPPPRRLAAYDYLPVAEITVSGSTVGLADSNLFFLRDPDDAIDPVEVARHLDQMQALGIDNIRVYVPWRFVEKTKGEYDWEAMDVVMSLAAKRDMGVLAEMNTTPAWVDPDDQFEPGAAHPDVKDFTDFASAVATRYGSTVSAYEIWNEPNYVGFYDPIDPAAYAELLKAVYPALKDIDPTATIVAAGLGHTPTYDDGTALSPVEFLDGMYDAGAKGYFDALAYHPYQETTPFSEGTPDGYALDQALAMVALMASNGDYVTGPGGQPVLDANGDPVTKRIWATEYGLATSRVTYEHQASYIQDFLATWSMQSWAGPAYVYTTVDSNPGSSDPEENFGVFTVDANGNWVRKPAADVLAEWILAHPNQTFDPAGPTNPSNPANPLTAFVVFVQQLVQQFTQSAFSFVNAVVAAITNFLGSFTRPTVSDAAPSSQRVAFGTGLDEHSAAAQAGETATAAAGSDAAVRITAITGSGAKTPIAEATPAATSKATEPTAIESTVTEPMVTEPTLAEGVSTTPEAEASVVSEATSATPETGGNEDSTTSSAAAAEAPAKKSAADEKERAERQSRGNRDKTPPAVPSPSTPSRSTTVQSVAGDDGDAGQDGTTAAKPASSGSED
ncbi:beta-galactosidase [Mycobacterium hodleri]|uniref:glycoside hydrolase family 5 protein n=1 Tax=Mycolicibacterium hodleri TaxID=49897 RepID=UPI0021F2F151|nr:glycoside hydrolase family 5 protein [Mycolicibacterium hodleri]MCV7133751.1 beta-galactosidase [Mycolicibacterium hodleri]